MAAASECNLEGFLKFVLQKTEELSLSKDGGSFSENFLSELLTHVDLLGKTTQLLHEIGDSSDDDDNKRWNDLENVYTEIEKDFISLFIEYHHKCTRTTTTCDLPLSKETTKGAGRPAYSIPKDVLVELRGLNFSWNKIAQMFGVSRWTIMRCVEDYGLIHLQQFSAISDERIDDIIQDYMSRHGHTTGKPFMSGYLRSLGLHIQRRRVRAAINRVDPRNTALRWGALVRRKTYFVPWANSLWHLDGHHSLIRWKFVVYGCCDGKSRKIMFLHCSTNNLAGTVLGLFKSAIKDNLGLWPSRIRVDYGVENVLVCDEMVLRRGDGRGSFIAGPSTRNQRIERLWRDVYRCVCHFFYYLFYAMEQTRILDLDNPLHMVALHLVFTDRINTALKEFADMFNNHRLSTEQGWTPNQIWMNGMLDKNNPLSSMDGVDEVQVESMYGEDPDGPRPLFDSEEGVVIELVQIEHSTDIRNFVLQRVDVNGPSSEAGIDIYTTVLALVVQKFEEHLSSGLRG